MAEGIQESWIAQLWNDLGVLGRDARASVSSPSHESRITADLQVVHAGLAGRHPEVRILSDPHFGPRGARARPRDTADLSARPMSGIRGIREDPRLVTPARPGVSSLFQFETGSSA